MAAVVTLSYARGLDTNTHEPVKVCKTITPAGVTSYPADLTYWRFEPALVTGFEQFASTLIAKARDRELCLIRGELKAELDRGKPYRKAYKEPGDPLADVDCYWLGLDFDEVELPAHLNPLDGTALASYARSLLPLEFHTIRCVWNLTAGAGFKPGGNIRLFCLTAEPYSNNALREWAAWLKDAGRLAFDRSLFRAHQPHYTALPVFKDGATDPVAAAGRERWGTLAGTAEQVTITFPAAIEPRGRSLRERVAQEGGTFLDTYCSSLTAAFRLRDLVHRIVGADKGDRYETVRDAAWEAGAMVKARHLPELPTLNVLYRAAAILGSRFPSDGRWGAQKYQRTTVLQSFKDGMALKIEPLFPDWPDADAAPLAAPGHVTAPTGATVH